MTFALDLDMVTVQVVLDRHPSNGLYSRTTWLSQNQKGSTNLDFNEARDDGVAVTSAGPYAKLHLASVR